MAVCFELEAGTEEEEGDFDDGDEVEEEKEAAIVEEDTAMEVDLRSWSVEVSPADCELV